jgi:uncharacterized membrane protein
VDLYVRRDYTGEFRVRVQVESGQRYVITIKEEYVALAAARSAPKQSLEKSALIRACVVGYIIRCAALLVLFLYFKTGLISS